jgi:hypothetical protein
MLERLINLQSHKERAHVDQVYQYVQSLYSNDSWIQEEYPNGMNAVLSSPNNFDEVLGLLQTSLQISSQVSCLLLEILRDCVQYSLTGGNEIFNMQSTGTEDKRDIIFKSRELESYLHQQQAECNIQQPKRDKVEESAR